MREFYPEEQDSSIESPEERERRLYGVTTSSQEYEREQKHRTFFEFIKELFLEKK